MRINKYIAAASGMSRRTADTAVARGKVLINGIVATAGQDVTELDTVTLNGLPLQAPTTTQTIMLNKPVGYVVSRDGQGSRTVYDLLPPDFIRLKPVGRLDKNSSGLLLMTNDGQLAQELTHPSRQKTKVYEVTLSKPLTPEDRLHITETGVLLDDGLSRFALKPLVDARQLHWAITMHEGRNRQIRRTFETLGYNLKRLHRTHFGPYVLTGNPGDYKQL
ncbi:MAG TPA: pseudouridine synthase [Candidatus Saccharimonadales bacterium]|nr:pseudouridine synthase [Candidatus Saccharimonadales bacterium]